ncbi:Hermansky-Pudlak syndrome 1 protein homolog [Actinia tenebrosa]|uniref:Hermansky-Pudlak syndrome 1 protein homolog n=1 Tax=Actinia tenebrosa TaxID=6105 RepID=A0A6P8IBT4_ACTTE|nr:Hermansky-Pudlak syndrome 1 protein homolog [Actinia tenebrosa]
MRAILIINSMPDILFVWEDSEFAEHINKVLKEAGFINPNQDVSKLDYGAMAQFFSPMIASLTYMNEHGSPYSSITCKDGTLFVFKQFNNMIFLAVNGSGDESEDFLRRKLTVVHRMAVMHYGASLDLLKPELPSKRKANWKRLGELIDAWQSLYSQQQSFLVEAVERINVNQTLSEMAMNLLNTALSTVKNKSDQNAVHALLLVNTKLFALYSSRNSIELQAADILMITSIVQNVFPYQSEAVPQSSTRPPPPLFNNVVSKGDPSVYQRLLDDDTNDDNDLPSGSGYHPPVSQPIAINDTANGDGVSMNSSVEEKFYSPSSTPSSDDMSQQKNDAFFSPRSDTLDDIAPQNYLDKKKNNENVTTEEAFPTEEAKQKNEYFRQPVCLNTPRCPYIPHVLHLIHVAKGTVLVLVNEVKHSAFAIPIYQVLNIVTRLESDASERKHTAQQASATMEKIEAPMKKIGEILKCSMGNAIDGRVRRVRDSWEMVKRSGISGYLTSKSHELPPGLDAAVNDMIRSLKSLFSVLYLSGPNNDVNQGFLDAVRDIQENIKDKLNDYEDYLLVKGERNVTMTAYLEDYPGLVHFIYIDRSGNQLTAPSLNTSSSEMVQNTRDPCHVLKQKIWDAWNLVHVFLLQGNTFVAFRDGDFLFTYCLWFEDSSGNPAIIQNSLPVFSGSSPPGILSGDGSFFRNLIRQCFPAAQEGSIRCYELLCMHVGLVPIRLAARHIRKLETALFETSLGAHYPISLIQ